MSVSVSWNASFTPLLRGGILGDGTCLSMGVIEGSVMLVESFLPILQYACIQLSVSGYQSE